jgi:hypothetical protein
MKSLERRNFLRYSVAAAVALPGMVSLTGCGGGGGGGSSPTTTSALSVVDTEVSKISVLQNSFDVPPSGTTSSLMLTSASTSTETVNLMLTSASNTISSDLFSKFQAGALKLNNYSTSNYSSFEPNVYVDQSAVWVNYLANHDLAYTQAKDQLAKLKAGLRLYGYKKSTSTISGIQASATVGTNTALDAALATFNTAIVNFKALNFGAVALDSLTLSVQGALLVFDALKGSTNGYSYITLALSAIEGLLKWIETKSLASFSFVTRTDIALSMAKLSIAVMSVMAIASLEKVKQSTVALNGAVAGMSTQDEQKLSAFLQSVSLQSQLVLTLTYFINGVMGNISTATQARADALAIAIADPNEVYTLTTEDRILIDQLKQQSIVLAAVGLVMKTLVGFYQSGFSAVASTDALQADAQTYALLFTNPISSYDTIFSGFTSTNFASLFANNTTIQQLMTQLATLNPTIALTVPTDAPAATTSAEVGVASFTSQLLSGLATGSFPSNTATQAALFTNNMAEMAYNFSMTGMGYAYNFAMTGMNYGYLFASRGEEVGLMADRILWMAVQIGQMSDRIGEMADRIVYTEQLIVYTEMLILDFGLLIYGGMKQISNTMLMGMAIVFDRQWYTPSTSDPILTVISDMTKQMLTNMQEYELTVLDNQNKLRETTLKALNWIQGAY